MPCGSVDLSDDTAIPLAHLSWVGGGTSKFFASCTYSQLRPPRATAAQSGGAWAAPRRTGAGDSDTKLVTIDGGVTMLGICAVLPRCG